MHAYKKTSTVFLHYSQLWTCDYVLMNCIMSVATENSFCNLNSVQLLKCWLILKFTLLNLENPKWRIQMISALSGISSLKNFSNHWLFFFVFFKRGVGQQFILILTYFFLRPLLNHCEALFHWRNKKTKRVFFLIFGNIVSLCNMNCLIWTDIHFTYLDTL